MRPQFRLQYVSNLHLHRYEKSIFPLVVAPAARYLALAGNIGKPSRIYTSFLDYASSRWDKVFYVAGNTERYLNLEEITKHYDNVFVLNDTNPSLYLQKENVAIVGAGPMDCTLQSQINRWTLQQAQICAITAEPPVLPFLTHKVRAWVVGGEAVAGHTKLSDTTLAVVNGRGMNETPPVHYSATATVQFATTEPDPNLDPLLAESANNIF